MFNSVRCDASAGHTREAYGNVGRILFDSESRHSSRPRSEQSCVFLFICDLRSVGRNFQSCFLSIAAFRPFGNVAEQLLCDVQERLVFRAHLYFKTDILQFTPSAGDLAYPEKLEMMKVIFCLYSGPLQWSVLLTIH